MRAGSGAVTPRGVTAGPSLGGREGEREMEDSPVPATLERPPSGHGGPSAGELTKTSHPARPPAGRMPHTAPGPLGCWPFFSCRLYRNGTAPSLWGAFLLTANVVQA